MRATSTRPLLLLALSFTLLLVAWTAAATLLAPPPDAQAARTDTSPSLLAHKRQLDAVSSSGASAPTPAPTHMSRTTPTASRGSSTFALVASYACNDSVVELVGGICSANRGLLDECEAESGAQPFLNSGQVPRAEVVSSLVASAACMSLTTAVALLELPACVLGHVPLRATCETLLVWSVDVTSGQAEAEDFHELLLWRRDSDLAQEAGEPYDAHSETFAAFSSSLRQALSQSHVSLRANDSIVEESTQAEAIEMSDGAQATFTGASGRVADYHDVVASVHAATASEASSKATTASTEATTRSSGTVRPATATTTALTAFTVAFFGLRS